MAIIKIRIGSVESVRLEDIQVIRAFYVTVGDDRHLFAVHARSAADDAEDRRTKPGKYTATLWESGARACCGDDVAEIEGKLCRIIANTAEVRGLPWVVDMLRTSAFDLYCNDLPTNGELESLLNWTDLEDEL